MRLDLQLGRCPGSGIDQGDFQRAGPAAGGTGLDPEYDAEGVAAAAGPAIVGSRLHVRPIAFRIRLADDEESIAPVARVAARSECELAPAPSLAPIFQIACSPPGWDCPAVVTAADAVAARINAPIESGDAGDRVLISAPFDWSEASGRAGIESGPRRETAVAGDRSEPSTDSTLSASRSSWTGVGVKVSRGVVVRRSVRRRSASGAAYDKLHLIARGSREPSSKVLALGLGFRPLRPDSEDVGNPDVMRRYMDLRRGTERVLRDWILPVLRESYEDTLAAARGSDLLVSHPITFATRLVAEKEGIRWASSMVSPVGFFSMRRQRVKKPSEGVVWGIAAHPKYRRL